MKWIIIIAVVLVVVFFVLPKLRKR